MRRGAIPPLPHTSSWRGAYLSTGTTLPLPILLHDFSSSRNVPALLSCRKYVGIYIVSKSVHVTKHHALKTYGGVEVRLHAVLALAIYGSDWAALHTRARARAEK
jgi:hypothetical protein